MKIQFRVLIIAALCVWAAAGTPQTAYALPDPAPTLTLGSNSVVGVVGNGVFGITIPADMNLSTGYYIQYSVPFNINFTTTALVSTTLTGGGTFSSCNGTSQILTCMVSGTISGGQTGTITVSGVKSIYAATSQTIAGSIVDNLDAAIASGTGGSVTDTTVGALTDARITPGTTLNEATGNVTVSFTTVTSIPNLGKISITFPSGFNVAGAAGTTASSLSGLNGTWTATVSGQTVTLTQSGGTSSAAGAKSFALSNIKNPTAMGQSGTVTILTKYTGNQSIETASATGFEVIGLARGARVTEEEVAAPESTPPTPRVIPAPTTSSTPEVVATSTPTLTTSTPVKLEAPAPTPPITPPVVEPIAAELPAPKFTKMLKLGSRGADVVLLQTRLESEKLLRMPRGVAKGYFGTLTHAALKKYQKRLGLKQTGLLDTATRAALEK